MSDMVILLVVSISEIKQLYSAWHQTYLGERTEQRKCVEMGVEHAMHLYYIPVLVRGKTSGIAFMSCNVRVSSHASCGGDAVRQTLSYKLSTTRGEGPFDSIAYFSPIILPAPGAEHLPGGHK
jgi:hypothetical protein